ncbi:hypothetical protein AAY473_007679 [Plecturocebus cupreus]
MKAAGRGSVPCKVTEVELSKAMGAHLLYQHNLDMRYGVKGDHFEALRFDCPAGFQKCMGPTGEQPFHRKALDNCRDLSRGWRNQLNLDVVPALNGLLCLIRAPNIIQKETQSRLLCTKSRRAEAPAKQLRWLKG